MNNLKELHYKQTTQQRITLWNCVKDTAFCNIFESNWLFLGEEISVQKIVPSKRDMPSLRHCQTALKFGKRHKFEMPVYHKEVEKLEAKTHAHVS